MILRLLVVIMVVRCQSLDLKDFGITWDLPIPTVDTVTLTSRRVTPTIETKTTEVPFVTSILIPSSSTVTSTFTREMTRDLISLNLTDLSREMRADYAFDQKVLPSITFDPLTEVPLPNDLYQNITVSTPMTMTFDEMEAEINKLEDEVEHLNVSDSNSTNIQPDRVNIWALTSKFLATQEGLAFFFTVVVSGKNFLKKIS